MTPLLVLLALTPAPDAGLVRSVNPDGNQHFGDGTYGRFDGDLELDLGVGGTVAFTGRDPGVAFRASTRWFQTAGVYVSYAEALSRFPDIGRRLGYGVELSPLFLVRWPQALETGPATLDLALDSLSLGLGVTMEQPRGRGFAARNLFELSLGVGVPLTGSAPGPWLEAHTAIGLPGPRAGEVTAVLLLAWHFPIVTSLVSGE